MEETKKCPYCGEEILAIAKKCKHCGEWLEEKNGVQSSTKSNAESEIAQSQTDKSQIEEEQPQTVETARQSEVQASEFPSQSSPQTNAAANFVEPDDLSKERTKRILYGIVIPTIATIVFAVALMVFHANFFYIYHYYLHWWVDEEDIVIPAIIAFVVLLAIYFLILYKIGVFKNNKVKKNVWTPKAKVVGANYRKHLTIGCIAILLLGIGTWYVVDKNAKAKATKEAVAKFNGNAQKIKADAKAIRKLSYIIFYDLYKNWRSAIWDNRAYDSDNERVYCSDFNDAIHWRHEFYSIEGCYGKLNKWNQEIETLIRDMQTPPEENLKGVLDKLMPVYHKAEEVVRYCNNPHGTLQSFGNKYETLLSELDNAIEGTDLTIGNVDDKADELYYDAITTNISNYIDKVLSK